MFAKVFNTARRILSRSPSVQSRPETPLEEAPRSIDPDSSMVTTRSGDTEERTLRSSVRKGKRALDGEEIPTSTSTPVKKRKKSVGAKGSTISEREGKTEDVVNETQPESVNDDILDTINVVPATVEPGSDPAIPQKNEALPIRRRTSPRVVIAAKPNAAEMEISTTDGAPPEEVAIYTEQDDADAIESLERGTNATSRPNKKQKKRGIKSGEREEGIDSGVARLPATTSNSAPKKAHIRFDSEEPAESGEPISGASYDRGRYGDENESNSPNVEEDDASDSDEAPEEVTIASALTKSKAAAADAARAYHTQQEKEKLKRKARAERIADEQKKKRRREEKKMKKLTKMDSREETIKPYNVDIHNLPALLPDSILEAAGERRPPTPPPTLPGMTAAEKRQEKLNRHIKFLERGERPIKDVKKGSVNVHVLGQQNPVLAPKVKRDTKNIREHWLKGRQLEKRHASGRKKALVKKMERRAVGGGFIRGED